jgi:hypothetical protein
MAGAAATGKMAARVRMLGLMGLRLVSFFCFFFFSNHSILIACKTFFGPSDEFQASRGQDSRRPKIGKLAVL